MALFLAVIGLALCGRDHFLQVGEARLNRFPGLRVERQIDAPPVEWTDGEQLGHNHSPGNNPGVEWPVRGSLVAVQTAISINNVNTADATSQQVEELDDATLKSLFTPLLTGSDDTAEVGVGSIEDELKPWVADSIVKRNDLRRLVENEAWFKFPNDSDLRLATQVGTLAPEIGQAVKGLMILAVAQ